MRRAVAWLEVVRRHPRHVALYAFVAGLLLGPVAPPLALVAAALAAALAGRLPLALAAAVAVLAGAALAQARVAALGPGRLPALAGDRIDARAILLEPVRTWRSGTAVARVRLLDGGPGLAGEIAVARAEHTRAPRGARVGSELRLQGTVAPLAEFEDYQRRRGAHAAIEVGSWTATGRARGGLAGALDAIRERAARGLGAGLRAPEAALLRGMVLGQDEAIGAATKEEFQRSGLAHLLAVSGQNVLLLCTLVLALGAVAGLPLRARLAAAIVLVAVYVPLAGGGPSIQRAGVMGIAGLVAALAGRPASRWYALGLAAAVTLALNPLAVAEPGWQLSFAAVAGLLALAPGLRGALTRRRVPGSVAEVAAITVAATLPPRRCWRCTSSRSRSRRCRRTCSRPPVVAPVMWLGMVAIALAQLSPGLAAPLNLFCAPLLGYLEWVAHAAAAAPLAAVPVRLGGPLGLAGAYAALAVAVHLQRSALAAAWHAGRTRVRRPRRVSIAAAAVALAVAVLGVAAAQPGKATPRAPGELVVSFLDVGQGDATLLQRGAASVLVDTGPPGGPILRRLDEAGVGAARPARPHARRERPRGRWRCPSSPPTARGWCSTAARAGRRRSSAGCPPRSRAPAAGRSTARAGQVLRVGRAAAARAVAAAARAGPARPPATRTTARSSRTCATGAFDLLLPADAESNVTAGARPAATSRRSRSPTTAATTPGLPAMLERTAPQVAAIEVGADNTYGHPTPATLGALRAVPQVVRTDRDGTVAPARARRQRCASSAAPVSVAAAASRLGRRGRPSGPPT